jgi:hypothetical protein
MNKRGEPDFLSDNVENFTRKKSLLLRLIVRKQYRIRKGRLLARTEFHQFSFDTLLSFTVFQPTDT